MDNPSPHEVSQYIQTLKELKEILIVGNPWTPVYASIGAAIAGGLIATVPNGIAALWRRYVDRGALEAALLAEIGNTALMIRKRGFLEEFKTEYIRLSEISPQNPNGPPPIELTIDVADGHFKIYEANLDKIGLLDRKKLPKIIHFYSLIESLILDVKPTGVLGIGGTKAQYAECIRFLEDALALADELSPPKT